MSKESEEQKLEQRLKNLEIKVLENRFDANSLGNLARNIKDYEGISEERKEQSLMLIYDNFGARFPRQFWKFYGSKSKIARDALSPLYEEVQKIYDFSKNKVKNGIKPGGEMISGKDHLDYYFSYKNEEKWHLLLKFSQSNTFSNQQFSVDSYHSSREYTDTLEIVKFDASDGDGALKYFIRKAEEIIPKLKQ